MSWSNSDQGRAGVIRERIAKRFETIRCTEPEESIKNHAAAQIDAALAAMPADYPVTVRAGGSQMVHGDVVLNELTLEIKPFGGWGSTV